jgi:hypothetical protein
MCTPEAIARAQHSGNIVAVPIRLGGLAHLSADYWREHCVQVS